MGGNGRDSTSPASASSSLGDVLRSLAHHQPRSRDGSPPLACYGKFAPLPRRTRYGDDHKVSAPHHSYQPASKSNHAQHSDNMKSSSSWPERSHEALVASAVEAAAAGAQHQHHHHRHSSLPDLREPASPPATPPSRRRVRFVSDECPLTDQPATPSEAPRRSLVRKLPWTDQKGIVADYTGQVNEHMQPDGQGALVYEDGTARTCIWKNGLPVQGWKPRPDKRTKRPSHDSGSGSKASDNMDTPMHKMIPGESTFLPHLDLGDVGAPEDMIEGEPTPSDLDSLQRHDFAFILRTDGHHTYAIIADRTDDAIRFVVDSLGSTKRLKRKYWQGNVRLVKKVGEISPSSVSHRHLSDSELVHATVTAEALPPPPLHYRRGSDEAVRPVGRRRRRSRSKGRSANWSRRSSTSGVLSLFD